MDSLWLKALDLQQCGLTDVITNDIMDLLDYNETLVVVDVRMNNNLQDELAEKIVKKLEQNNAKGKSEYKWFNLPKKQFSKAIKRNDRQEDGNTLKTMSKRMKNHCHSILSKSNSCKNSTIESNKEKSFSKLKQQTKISNDNSKHLLLNLNSQMEISDGFNNLESESSKEEKEEILEQNDENSKNLLFLSFFRIFTKKKIFSISEIEIDIQEILIKDNKNENLEVLQQQLEEARREYQFLLKRTKENEILLLKERIRRETTEKNLLSLQNNITELENVLRKKKEETHGYLLVSQNSLNEICSSFDSLIELLEIKAKNHNINSQSNEEIIISDDIRTKMAILIRKTKSESFRRGYFTEEISNEMKKYARSEADVRNLLPLIDIIHYEKNIGDNPDIISEENTSRRMIGVNVYNGEKFFFSFLS